MRILIGGPAALRVMLAARVREFRDQDPLSPITVLVGTSQQRPFLARWLAARLGGHANVRILMPGDLALKLHDARIHAPQCWFWWKCGLAHAFEDRRAFLVFSLEYA
jgi:hypothetical protein